MSNIDVIRFVLKRQSKPGKVLVVQSHSKDKCGTTERNDLWQGWQLSGWLIKKKKTKKIFEITVLAWKSSILLVIKTKFLQL